MDIGLTLGILSGIVQAIAYVIYNRGIWTGKITPNPASWGLWGFLTILNTTSYFAASGDWVKSILTVTNSTLCLATLALSFVKGRFRPITHWADKAALFVGIIAGCCWYVFKSASFGNVIMQLAIIFGFVPLYRSIIAGTANERALPWLVWTAAYALNILTVIVRWDGKPIGLLYPACCVITHTGVALLSMIRLQHGTLRTAIIIAERFVVKVPRLSGLIDSIRWWDKPHKELSDASLKLLSRLGLLTFLQGCISNMSEYYVYLATKKAPSLVQTWSVGIVSFQRYETGSIPSDVEINTALARLPKRARDLLLMMDGHAFDKKNWRRNEKGLRLLDYGDHIGDGKPQLSILLLRYYRELSQILCEYK